MSPPVTRDVVIVEGADAVAYLQGQLSQDIPALAVGASALTFLLEPQGRVVAIARVARRGPERVELDVEPGVGAAVVARLQRFKLRTKAEITMEEAVPFAVHRSDGAAPEGALVPTTPGVAGWDLARDGASTTDPLALDVERITRGVPAVHDLDERTVPAETGLVEAAASFTKGCYTGQELVARMDSRVAAPPRRIRRISGTGTAPPVGTSVLTPEGSAAGVLTSVAGVEAGWIGLALVPRAVDPGPVTATWEGGRSEATVEP